VRGTVDQQHVLAFGDDSFEVLVLAVDGRPATDVRLSQRARVGNSIGLNAPLHPGRTRASEIEHVATSSLRLSRSAFVARECWIGASDLEWRRAELSPAEVSRVEMRLRLAGALEVDLMGLDPADAAGEAVPGATRCALTCFSELRTTGRRPLFLLSA
jgi:hypothetical protein